MSSFTEPLTVTKIITKEKKKFLGLIGYEAKKQHWVVERSFRFYFKDESGPYIDIERGTVTDFASSPRFTWIIFPPDGLYAQASVVHDELYRLRGRVPTIPEPLTRAQCDLAFLTGMEVLGVNVVVRNIMYQAVDKFGWIPWNRKK